MKHIWILGSQGRLGAALMRKWTGHYDLRGLSRADCDIRNAAKLREALEPGNFDWIVNCAAMTNVDACESERDAATAANAEAPRIIGEICASKSARLLHISTDYVFDGHKEAPYLETDAARPLGFYGETKLAGEKNVLSTSPRHIVVRVSWVFGPEKPSFVDAMIQRAINDERVQAIDDKTSSPSYTDDIADWLRALIDKEAEGGLYHASNSGGCTWREYAEHAIRYAADNGLAVKTRNVEGIPLASMKAFVAPRPVNTILNNQKLAAAIGTPPRGWKPAVEDFVRLKHLSKK